MNWEDFRLRLRALLFRRSTELELNEEIAAHLELQARKHLMLGIDPDEALQLARRDFGSIECAKDLCRDERRVSWFANLSRDLQYAARIFGRDLGFSMLAVIVLALAIGSNVASFSVMDALLLKMLPVEDPSSLFRVVRASASSDDASGVACSYAVIQRMRERTKKLADLMAYQVADQQSASIADSGEQTLVHQTISGNYFAVLGVKPALGSLIAPADDSRSSHKSVAVISTRLWKKYFGGSPAALGAKVRLRDQVFEVTGVAPPEFFGVEVGKIVDLWTPIAMALTEYLHDERFFWLQPMGRLHKGIGIAQAAAPMQAVVNEVVLEDVRQHAPPGTPKSVIDKFLAGMRIKGTSAGGGIASLRQQYRIPLKVVMCLVSIVLLIACTNVANLLLAKGNVRRQEIAIRLSLGAGRWRVLQQLITESALLGLLSTVVGVLFAHWLTPIVVRMLAPATSPADFIVGFNLRLLSFVVLVAFVTVVLSGLIPAISLIGSDVFENLRSGRRSLHQAGKRNRQVLVSAQIALSLVLLIGSALFSRTLSNLLSSPLGFQTSKVVLAGLTLPRLGDEQQLFPLAWDKLLRQAQLVPGIERASLTSSALFSGNPQYLGLRIRDKDSGLADPTAAIMFVSAGYFRTLTIQLFSGRDLTDGDSNPSASSVAVVNRAFARKFFGQENPVGQKLSKIADSPSWTEIVGVVEDTKLASLRDPAPPIVYVPYVKMNTWMPPQAHAGFAMTLQLRGEQQSSNLAAQLAKESGSKFRIVRVSEQQRNIDDTILRERLMARFATFFAALSLVLATLGLYGVVNYTVIQRRQEIGIRMAMGAAPSHIIAVFFQESLVIILIGISAGTLVSLPLVKTVRAMLYGFSAGDPAAFLIAACVLIAATFVAALVPAYRASMIDPVLTLRND